MSAGKGFFFTLKKVMYCTKIYKILSFFFFDFPWSPCKNDVDLTPLEASRRLYLSFLCIQTCIVHYHSKVEPYWFLKEKVKVKDNEGKCVKLYIQISSHIFIIFANHLHAPFDLNAM